MIISYNIKKYRTEKNLSQEELAKLMNISRQSISKWERGESMPSIDNLLVLSDLLSLPLDSLIKRKNYFPLDFDYGKPKNKTPIFLISFFPGLMLGSSFFTNGKERLILIPVSLFILLLTSSVGFFDFKRYYSYFTVNGAGILIFNGNKKVFPIIHIILSIFNKRKTREIPFSDIESAKIYFDTYGYKGVGTSVIYRPRYLYNVRETFECHLLLKSGEKIILNLSQAFYPNSKERQYFYNMFLYFYERGIKIKDSFGILKSIKQEYDFIEQAYNSKK